MNVNLNGPRAPLTDAELARVKMRLLALLWRKADELGRHRKAAEVLAAAVRWRDLSGRLDI